MMKDLVTLEEYIKSVNLPAFRVAAITGLLFGPAFTVLFFILMGYEFVTITFALTLIVSGVLFGIMFSLLLQFSFKGQVCKLYSSSPDVPTDFENDRADYSYRLPCSLKVTSSMAIGGCLYIGRKYIYFLPNIFNLQKYRNPIKIAIDEQLETSTEIQKTSIVTKIIFKNIPDLLVITNANSSWRFLVPCPDKVHERIDKIFENMN